MDVNADRSSAGTAAAKRGYRAPGELPSPPAGAEVWTKEQCAAHFNVSHGTWGAWERGGRITIPRYRDRARFGPAILYLKDDLAKLGIEAAVPFAPEGAAVMTREECAEHFNVALMTWAHWEREGLVTIPRYKVAGPHRPLACYLTTDVETLPFARGYPLPPAGAAVMTRDECAAYFGISEDTLCGWEADGRIPIPRYRCTGGGARVCYLASDVATLELELPPPPPPEGVEVLTREECAQHWGVSVDAWGEWERKGLVSIPRYRVVKGVTRKYCYAAADVRALPFAPPLPLPPEGVEVWTRDECAAYFGITEDSWNDREVKGEVPLRRYRWTGDSPHKCCYLASEVAGLDGRVLPPQPPDGLAVMDREECAAFFGIALDTFGQWEQQGKVTIPRYRRIAGAGTRRMCYAVEDATRLREEFRAAYAPYPDPRRPGCWRVPIVTGKGAMQAVIDEADLAIVRGRNWNIHERFDEDQPRGDVVLATDTSVSLKRLITGTVDRDHTVRISHRNGDYLDCTRANLYARSLAEQTYGNRKIRFRNGRECTSKFKGVSWVEARGKWTAHIGKDGKAYYLGLFIGEEDAARAYDEAARRMFGEHARLNFPEEEALLMHRDPTAERRAA